MKRAAFYIDGQNMYHGLTEKGHAARTFDYPLFAKHLCQSKNGFAPKEVAGIKYYAAQYPAQVDRAKHDSDTAYYASLGKLGVSVRLGRFLVSQINGRDIPREKGVDVLLATDLLVDAFHNFYDCAYILSADTDITPAISEVKKHFKEKQIYSCSFQDLIDFENCCDSHIKLQHMSLKKYFNPKLFAPTATTIQGLKEKFGRKP